MIFLIEFLLGSIVYFEYRNYKLVVTPTTVLGGIYFLFIPMINTFGQAMGFLKIEDKTMLCFAFFVFVLFLSGLAFSVYFNNAKLERGVTIFDIGKKIEKKETIIWILFLISLVCYVISLLQVIERYGINNTKSKAFGPFAHIGFLSRCLLPIIIYYLVKKRKAKYLVAVAINIIALIMFQGKYHLYIPIASFIVLFLIIKKDISIKQIMLVVIGAFFAGVILFVSVYTIIPNIIAGNTSWESMSTGIQFSVKHFFHYLFCPFICSNEYFANPVYRTMEEGIRTNFNALDTLAEQFLGNRNFFSPVITLWPAVDTAGTTANVGGLFSESVLNIGFPLSVAYVGIIGAAVYYFTVRCLLEGKRIITTICLSGTIMMSFFCNYFSLLPNIECLVYCYLFDFLLMDRDYTM